MTLCVDTQRRGNKLITCHICKMSMKRTSEQRKVGSAAVRDKFYIRPHTFARRGGRSAALAKAMAGKLSEWT